MRRDARQLTPRRDITIRPGASLPGRIVYRRSHESGVDPRQVAAAICVAADSVQPAIDRLEAEASTKQHSQPASARKGMLAGDEACALRLLELDAR
jgi:hypothetical protein